MPGMRAIAAGEFAMTRKSDLPDCEASIKAELEGSHRCAALGIIGRGEAPALELCRRLIELGVDPQTPLHVYRGSVLALVIRAIGEGAELRAATNHQGTPVFQKRTPGPPGPAAAPPIAPIASTLPETPPDEITAPTPAGAYDRPHGSRP
jgi:hypothetical protein